MGALHLGISPPKPFRLEAQRFQERRRRGEWVDPRTDVVQQAGNGELSAARTAANLVGRLDQVDAEPFARDRYGGGEPVGAPAHYDRIDQRGAAAAPGGTGSGAPSHG